MKDDTIGNAILTASVQPGKFPDRIIMHPMTWYKLNYEPSAPHRCETRGPVDKRLCGMPVHLDDMYPEHGFALQQNCRCNRFAHVASAPIPVDLKSDVRTGLCTDCRGTLYKTVYRSDDWRHHSQGIDDHA